MTIVSYINRSQEQDFNSVPFEYEAEILSTNRNVKTHPCPNHSEHNGYQFSAPLALTLLNSEFCPQGVFWVAYDSRNEERIFP
jgi:hypothetical protein